LRISPGATHTFNIMLKVFGYLRVGACLLMVAGCRETNTYSVSGQVAFGGEKVSNGEIVFISTDKKSAPVAARIENGEYQLKATPGAKRVEIRAARIVGTIPGAIGPQYQDYIPAEFNSNSTLGAEVQASDNNRFDFNLELERKR
jgi:hypothetical protein